MCTLCPGRNVQGACVCVLVESKQKAGEGGRVVVMKRRSGMSVGCVAQELSRQGPKSTEPISSPLLVGVHILCMPWVLNEAGFSRLGSF